MTLEEEQQIVYALNQVIGFFGKELDEMSTDLWMRALRKYPAALVRRSLADYTEKGKYAPKPRDIIELVEGHQEEKRRTDSLQPKALTVEPASPKVARAWRYVISQWGGDAATMFDTKLSQDEVEEAIELVNQQVAASGNWDSVPEHLQLDRYKR